MKQLLFTLKILMIIGPWDSTAITNKRPSNEQSGSVRYFRHISNGPSSGPLADWEIGLREAIHQALLREGYWEPNLRERLTGARLIGRQDLATPFGDVAVLARGQIYAIHGGNFILLQDPYQNDCDDCHTPKRCERHDCQPYTPHNREIVVALWSVKRLRHRDIDRTRFELEYIISPINAKNDQIVMRRGRFNYAIPGHVFVIRSSQNNKDSPEYYNRKIVQTHFKPEVILGVDSEGHKHVLYSYPGFITPQAYSIATSPSSPTTQTSTTDIKEAELYKKLLETLASKTSTTQKHEEGPHRFSLNGFGDINRTVPIVADQSITTPLVTKTSIKPQTENNLNVITAPTKPTIHYFMPTGEEVLMTQSPSLTSTETVTQKYSISTSKMSITTPTTEQTTPLNTIGTSKTIPTKKKLNTKSSFKTKTNKSSTGVTSKKTKPTTSTKPKSTSTSEMITIPTTPLTRTLSTLPPTTQFSTTIMASSTSTTPKTTTQFNIKSTITTTSTQKSPGTSSRTKTASLYPIYRRPKPFSPDTTKLISSTTNVPTQKLTTLKLSPVTTQTSTVVTKELKTIVSMQQFSSKILIETTSQLSTLPTLSEEMITTSITTNYTMAPTTLAIPTKSTTEIYTITEIPEIPSNVNSSSQVSPTEPMRISTETPISTTILMPVEETSPMPKETTLIETTSSNPVDYAIQVTTPTMTTSPQTPSILSTLPSEQTRMTKTYRTTTASDFLTESEPFKGPLYIGTVKNDYDLDDIFGTTKSTMKPTTSTTQRQTESDIAQQLFDNSGQQNAKIIFSNFYEPSTTTYSSDVINDDPSKDYSFLTSQSYETSVSYEVNKRNQPEYPADLTTVTPMTGSPTNKLKPKIKGVEYKRNRSKLSHYKPVKITMDLPAKANIKQVLSNGTDYVIYKAEYPNDSVDINQTQSTKEENESIDTSQTESTKEAFDNAALMLVNHAKSLEYLSKADNKTVRVKYRKRKVYIPRSRTTRKPTRKRKEMEST